MPRWMWWTDGRPVAAAEPAPPPTPRRRRTLAFQPCARCCGCDQYKDLACSEYLDSQWTVIEGEWEGTVDDIRASIEYLGQATIFSKAVGTVPYKLHVGASSSIITDPYVYYIHPAILHFAFLFGCDADFDSGYLLLIERDDTLWHNCFGGNEAWATLYSFTDGKYQRAYRYTNWVKVAGPWGFFSPFGYASLDVCAHEDHTLLNIQNGQSESDRGDVRIYLPDLVLGNHYSGLHGYAPGVSYSEGSLVDPQPDGTIFFSGYSISDIDPDDCPDCDVPCECDGGLPDAIQVDISGVTGDGADDWNGSFLCEIQHQELELYGYDPQRCVGVGHFGWRYPCYVAYNSPSGTRGLGPVVYLGEWWLYTEAWAYYPPDQHSCQYFSHAGVVVKCQERHEVLPGSGYYWYFNQIFYNALEEWSGSCVGLDVTMGQKAFPDAYKYDPPRTGYLDWSSAVVRVSIPT